MHAQSRTFAIGLNKLRLVVMACAWTIGLTLGVQIVIWGLMTGTAWHYEEAVMPAPAIEAPLVVESPSRVTAPGAAIADKPIEPPPTRPTVVFSAYNASASLARAAGTMALIVLLPIIIVTIVGVSSVECPTIERAVSSMVWAIILAVLCLPVGTALGLPWMDGAFYSFAIMSDQIGMVGASAVAGSGQLARYLLLPGACIFGTIVMAWRFNAGVAPVIVRGDWKLDEGLEREAANIKISSLHGGRAGGSMLKLNRDPAPPADDDGPAATAVSAGKAPRRII